MLHRHKDQGFEALTLSDDQHRVTVIPQLGGRISSLVSVPRQREWLFAPSVERKVFTNTPADAFTASTHVGIDECLPSVSTCQIDGYVHADHGEAWARAWVVERADEHEITLSIILPYCDLHLERRITLGPTGIRCAYSLRNSTSNPVRFLWAFHALFGWQPGDRIALPSALQQAHASDGGIQSPQFVGGGMLAWPVAAPGVDLSANRLGGDDTYAKVTFASTGVDHAHIRGVDGATLALRWDAHALHGLGIWLSHGGYRNQYCVAIEPSSHAADTLDHPFTLQRQLAPHETRTWWVELLAT